MAVSLRYNLHVLLFYNKSPDAHQRELMLRRLTLEDKKASLQERKLISNLCCFLCDKEARAADYEEKLAPLFKLENFVTLATVILEVARQTNIFSLGEAQIIYKAAKPKTVQPIVIQSKFLDFLINEVAVSNLQLPFVVPPKDFVMTQKGVYQGGY